MWAKIIHCACADVVRHMAIWGYALWYMRPKMGQLDFMYRRVISDNLDSTRTLQLKCHPSNVNGNHIFFPCVSVCMRGSFRLANSCGCARWHACGFFFDHEFLFIDCHRKWWYKIEATDDIVWRPMAGDNFELNFCWISFLHWALVKASSNWNYHFSSTSNDVCAPRARVCVCSVNSIQPPINSCSWNGLWILKFCFFFFHFSFSRPSQP